MSLLTFIRQVLELLAARLYLTAGNRFPYFVLFFVSVVTLSFICQRRKMLKRILSHILKCGFQQGRSYILKEKSKPDFNVLKSVFMDGMSYRYREWANPVVYFNETFRTGGEGIDSGSNSDEESSPDETEDSNEQALKIESDYSNICISSTKSVFESLPESQIPYKRKAESDKAGSSKRPKSSNPRNVGEASNSTREITDVSVAASSDMRSNTMNERTSTRVSQCSSSQPKRMVTKSTQTETMKTYSAPKKMWKNRVRDEPYSIPSDPRIRDRNISGSPSCLGPYRSFQNPLFRITQDNTQTRTSMSYGGSTTAENYSMGARPKNREPEEKSAFAECPVVGRNISQISISESKTSLEKSKDNSSSNVSKNNGPRDEPGPADDPRDEPGPTDNPRDEPDPEDHPADDLGDDSLKNISKVKIYPGLSLQPLKVKKDARYQKKFYKERKEITLPKKLGEVIQWAASKSSDEIGIPDPDDLPPTDDADVPIDEYRERAQELAKNFMTMFDNARQLKAKRKLARKNRREQNKQLRKNIGYIEGSFREESPSSISSSDSLPSGDSPVRESPLSPPASHSVLPPDYDLSRVQVSPLKPEAEEMKVIAEFLSKAADCLYKAPPSSPVMEPILDKNGNVKPARSGISPGDPLLEIWVDFIDWREVIIPGRALFCRDILWNPGASPENQRLRPFFGIEDAASNRRDVSVEESLHQMRRTQDTYYRALYSEDTEYFRNRRRKLYIRVIPLLMPERADGDYELEGDSLVKKEMEVTETEISEEEQNLAPSVPHSDCILEENVPKKEPSESIPEGPDALECGQNPRGQATSRASRVRQSQEPRSGSSTNRNNWTLQEIELAGPETHRQRSGGHFSRNIPTREAEMRIESRMEEWPAGARDSNEAAAASAPKNAEKRRPGQTTTTDPPLEPLPILFGYPSADLMARIMRTARDMERSAAEYYGQETMSERSEHSSSSTMVDRKNAPKKQMSPGVSTQSRGEPEAGASGSVEKRYEADNTTTHQTETNLGEHASVEENLRPRESDPIIAASGLQDQPCGSGATSGVTIKQESSKTEKYIESDRRTLDIFYKLRSITEKPILSPIESPSDSESSSDPENT